MTVSPKKDWITENLDDDIELNIDDSLIDYDDAYAHEDWDDEALTERAITPLASPHPLGQLATLHDDYLPF